LALQKAFSGEYIVQDDARQHVFWMRRFLDGNLFPHDLIADYFQSVAPIGYRNLYKLMAVVGIDPVVGSKILPVILGLVTTFYCFAVCLQLLPIPLTGFIAATLLNQNLWMQDGLVSGTPKAFIYPCFLAFLYYLLRRDKFGLAVAIALFGLFYPSLVLVCAVLLMLKFWRFRNFVPQLSASKSDRSLYFLGLGVAILILLPYALAASEFAPVITAAEARELPEFVAGARASFFHDRDPWRFWFNASRSGIRLPSALMPQLVYAALLFPVITKFPARFPLTNKLNQAVIILPQLLVASLVMFFAAHALLFKLHLPSRYTQHSLRIVMMLAASLVLTIMLDAIFQWAGKNASRQLLAIGATTIVGLTLMVAPVSWKSFPWTGYIVGNQTGLYQFFQQQPQDIAIASLAEEANNLPTFAQRSILVGSEYAIPYHLGYYRPFRQRVIDLIQAQYSTDLVEITKFIRKYGIDFWIVEESSFVPEYLDNNSWLKQHQPVAQEAVESLRQQKVPLLTSFKDSCSVWQDNNLTVISTSCILSSSS
jgi:hypothetical protein